ncbi:MAG TPA: glycosyltransferase family protein [Bacteroidales bacterium]|nr:glycosyltransferase family protein [Bacteroidales bacterium]
MKILAITQARYGSSRLPGKVLKTINGKTLLEIHLERILQSKAISKLKVATTIEAGAEMIESIANNLGVDTFKGSIDDVLGRFYFTALPEKPDIVVRLTSDCPLIDPIEIDRVIEICIKGGYDYASNALVPTFPDGVDTEVFKFSALEIAYKDAILKSDREHVTPYIWRNSSFKGGDIFTSFNVENPEDYSKYRITVDTLVDFAVIENLVKNLGIKRGWMDYIKYLDAHPNILNINANEERNEGYKKSLENDNN